MCLSSPEVDEIKFDPDIIKKFMEEHQGNYLYFLNNPYHIRFSINDLSAVVDNQIYGLINLKEEDEKLTTRDEASNVLHGFIKTFGSIIMRNDSLQSFNHQILAQNEKILCDNSRMNQYEKQFETIGKALSTTQTCIHDLYELTKANQQQIAQTQESNQQQIAQAQESNQQQILRAQESIQHLYEVATNNQTLLLKYIRKSEN